VAFIASLIDVLVTTQGVDPKRVYATGLSNGAMMCHTLALRIPDRIVAIAPVADSITKAVASGTTTEGPPVSVLAMNGTDDPLVPYEGGEVHFGRTKLGEVISVADMIKLWVQRDGCSTEPEVTDLEDKDPNDGTRVRRERHAGKEAEVVLYTIKGGGHTWPGGKQYLGERIIGKTTRDIDGCQVIWDFFKAHVRD